MAWRGFCAFRELMPLHAPLNDLVGSLRHRHAMRALSSACLRGTDSALYLVHGLRLWDAELVLRSVLEGTLKFGYVLESPATLTIRCVEYSDTLPSIAKLRWHDKATAALTAVRNPHADEWQPFRELLLPEEEVERTRAAYPRKMRAEVEGRWGFTALVNAVSKQGGAFGPGAKSVLHSYSVASHLQHMSCEGVDLPFERDTRPQARREAIELAHAARLVSDCFHYTFHRVGAVLRFFGRPTDQLEDVRARHQPLLAELKEAGVEWTRIEYPQRGADISAA
jgi:hypothetical protein